MRDASEENGNASDLGPRIASVPVQTPASIEPTRAMPSLTAAQKAA